ncbi:hypothetical protein KIN20_020325 [Parelaphostrongylus tenuis]|uniref:Uncharacterized protein n=1 Tax=Parelaphostrongylus tenuis TaxID=148309 RepID=A0AAD5QT85_PARTN|nr:hypothetical protein KIN20_020325 [Parelaphostrongylus tenuis]
MGAKKEQQLTLGPKRSEKPRNRKDREPHLNNRTPLILLFITNEVDSRGVHVVFESGTMRNSDATYVMGTQTPTGVGHLLRPIVPVNSLRIRRQIATNLERGRFLRMVLDRFQLGESA